jgi:hypothetical protein
VRLNNAAYNLVVRTGSIKNRKGKYYIYRKMAKEMIAHVDGRYLCIEVEAMLYNFIFLSLFISQAWVQTVNLICLRQE